LESISHSMVRRFQDLENFFWENYWTVACFGLTKISWFPRQEEISMPISHLPGKECCSQIVIMTCLDQTYSIPDRDLGFFRKILIEPVDQFWGGSSSCMNSSHQACSFSCFLASSACLISFYLRSFSTSSTTFGPSLLSGSITNFSNLSKTRSASNWRTRECSSISPPC
jgi:hypothetical protein